MRANHAVGEQRVRADNNKIVPECMPTVRYRRDLAPHCRGAFGGGPYPRVGTPEDGAFHVSANERSPETRILTGGCGGFCAPVQGTGNFSWVLGLGNKIQPKAFPGLDVCP